MLILFALAIAGCLGQGGGKKVRQLNFTKGFEEGSREFPEIAIRPAGGQPVPPTAFPLIPAGYCRPFANDELNSRLGARLPRGKWVERWTADLNPQLTPAFVLECGDRIVVRSEMWALFDRNGGKLGEGQAAGEALVMDPAHKVFYQILPSGYFGGVRMSDGQPEFLFLPAFGDLYGRNYLARHGSRILVTAVERAIDPHGGQTPSKSLMEVNDIGDPVKISTGRRVAGLQAIGELEIPSLKLLTASHGESIVGTSSGVIYVTNWELVGKAALTATFQPRSISLDESGRIYLVVEEGGTTKLWLLTHTGERLYSFEFPPGAAIGTVPPIIAHNHTAYVIGGNYIYAIGGDGKLNWSHEAPARISGAAITGDDQLLVSQGSRVVAWDQNGFWRPVHAFDEELVTPPVLTNSNTLLVASKKKLYSLAVEK